MRIHIIACRVFSRELSYYAAQSPHIVDITWLPQGLHDTPQKLRNSVAAAIDQLYRQYEENQLKYFPDAIVLGYGLCSNGVVGIEARDIPIIVPRTDDCIALFLGSQQRYLQLFNERNGTYWLNTGWIENAFIPTREVLEKRRQEYSEQFGEDNADFLMEQDMLWSKNYRSLGYIISPVYAPDAYTEQAKEVAAFNGWDFLTFEGENRMLINMVNGLWDDSEFLVCPPGHRIEATYDGSKITAIPTGGNPNGG